MRLPYGVTIAACLLIQPTTLRAADAAQIDRLTTYTTLLGRAMACGIAAKDADQKVERWVERTFTDNTGLGKIMFLAGKTVAFRDQSLGKSPDTCDKIAAIFPQLEWPREPTVSPPEPFQAVKPALDDGGTYVDPDTLVGWWVVVGSVPVSDSAEKAARMSGDYETFTAAGKRCGYEVFNDFSFKFTGFKPGYNVFVIGAFPSADQAKKVVASVSKCLPGAYVKHGRYLGE